MPNNLSNKKLLTIGQAAELLDVSLDTIRRWDKNGTLHAIRADGKNRFFDEAEIASLQKEKKLSISEAASKLGVSITTLRRLEKKGLLIAERNSRNERVYSQHKIQAFINKVSPHPLSYPMGQENVPSQFDQLVNPELIEKLSNEEHKLINENDAPQSFQAPQVEKKEEPQQPTTITGKHLRSKSKFYLLKAPAILSPYQRTLLGFLTLLVVIPSTIYIYSVSKAIIFNDSSNLSFEQKNISTFKSVLAAATKQIKGSIKFSIPAIFNDSVTFKNGFVVDKLASFSAGLTVNNSNITVTNGSVFADNLLYKLTAGTGLSLTTGQTPTITNTDPGTAQKIFKTIKVGSDTFDAGSNTDTLTFAAGSGITLAIDSGTKKVTLTNSSTADLSGFTDDGSIVRLTNSTDNVGIGTTNPAAKLDVVGNLKVSGTTNLNGIAYTWPSADGSNLYVLSTNGTGTLSWQTVSAVGATNYWTISNGALSPTNTSLDLLLGATATTSAKFGFLNVNTGTPVASISANSGNLATYLTGDGTLATTNRQNLTIGNSSTYNTTGNVLINSNGTGYVGIGTTAPNAPLHVAGTTSIFGSGEGGTPTATTIRGAAATGNDVAGANLTFDASNGTGAGGSGALVFRTAPAASAITYTASKVQAGTATSATISFTTSGSNRMLIVSNNSNNSGVDETKTTVTYNGVSMTRAGSNGRNSIWYLIAPASGTNNLVISFFNSSSVAQNTDYAVNIMNFSGVSQSATPTYASATGTSTSPSVTITTSGSDTVVDSVMGSNPTANGSQTQLATASLNNAILTSSFKNATGTSTTMSWTLGSSQSWTHQAINISPIAGSSADTLAERLRITPSGNVGIGTSNPSGLLDISGSLSSSPSLAGEYLSLSASTLTDTTTAASSTLTNAAFNAIAQPTLAAANSSVTTTNAYTLYLGGAPLQSTNETITNSIAFGIGAGAVSSATNSYGLYVNAQTGATNNYAGIFTGGNVGIGLTAPTTTLDVTGTFKVSGTTNFNSIAYTWPGSQTAGYFLQTNGSGTLSWADPLTSTGWFRQSSGALSPINNTLDLLLGNTATTSAKFGFLNVNTGTPVASISANSGNLATYLTGDGTLATTNRQNLTIGNSSTYNTTGNVLINSNGTGNVGIGASAPTAKLEVAGNIALTGGSNRTISIADTTGSTGYNLTLQAGAGTSGGVGDLILHGINDGFGSGGNIKIYTDDVAGTGIIYMYPGQTPLGGVPGAIALAHNGTRAQGLVGVGTNSPTALLHVNGGNQGGNAALIINQVGAATNDIIAASSSGTTRFMVKNDGTASSSAGFVIDAAGSLQTTKAQTLTLGGTTTGDIVFKPGAASSPTLYLQTGGNVGIGTSTPTAPLHINSGNLGGNAALIVNQTGASTNDILTASSSGTTYFRVTGTNNGQVFIGDGNGASPALTFLNDTNTGFTRASADNIRFIANGQPALGIDGTSGTGRFYVGVGTPVSRIHVYDDGNDTASGITLGGTPATYVQIYKSGSNQLTIANASVGIGATAPAFKLDVQDTQSATVAAQIFNTNTGTDADGLMVKLGFTGTGTAPAGGPPKTGNRFIVFSDGNGNIQGAVDSNGSNGLTYATNGIDFAEYFSKENSGETFEEGDLVCLSTNGKAIKCDQTTTSLLGIVSKHPGFAGGSNGPDKVLVGLVGQVPLKVVGTIHAGDPLTISDHIAVAQKATNAGYIIGRALENYDNQTPGLIKVYVHVNWYDPGLQIASSGTLSTTTSGIAFDSNGDATLPNLSTQTIQTQNLAAQHAIIDTLSGNYGAFKSLDAKQLTSNSLAVSESITTASIGSDAIKAHFDNESLTVKASDSALFTINKQGDATLSGKLFAKEGAIDTLSVKRLVVEQIETTTNASAAAIFNLGSQGIKTDLAEFKFATIKNDLIALGNTTLGETAILGKLTLSNTIQIDANSINSIGEDLELQPLKQGNIVLMGGLVSFDTEGNMKVAGNASFAKNVEVKGILSATTLSGLNGEINVSGSASFENIKLSGNQQATGSATQVTLNAAAGKIKITSGQTQLVVNNPKVGANSLIYITPTSKTYGQTPYISNQAPGASFTVKIEQPVSEDIEMNFLIVN